MVRRLLASLFLGAVLTICTAWSCVMWVSGRWVPPPTPESYNTNFDNTATIDVFGFSGEELWGARGSDDYFKQWWGSGLSKRRAGFPFKALQSEVQAFHDQKLVALQGWNLPTSELFRRGYPTSKLPPWLHAQRERRLPFVPMFPGILINTIFWGSFSWLALSGLDVLRRRGRTKRDLCVSCKYTLAGLETCPECNTPAKQKSLA